MYFFTGSYRVILMRLKVFIFVIDLLLFFKLLLKLQGVYLIITEPKRSTKCKENLIYFKLLYFQNYSFMVAYVQG